MNARNPFQAPRSQPARPTSDPERAQKFANWATALGLVALASVAASLAAVGGFAWLTRGRGHQVGELGYLAIFGVVGLLFVVFAQQVGPTLKTGARLATVVALVAVTIASPLLAVLHSLTATVR